MRTQRYQTGLSSSQFLALAVLFGFVLTLFFKMGPVYLNNQSLQSAIKSMALSSTDLNRMEDAEIYKQISNFFAVNGVRDHSPRDLKIVRKRDFTLINLEYETRIHLFLNVDVVMSFRNQVDSSNVDKCCKFLVEDEK